MKLRMVAEEDAKHAQYPYIFINKDGTYRELRENERQYLEAEFHPADSGRPYIKKSYNEVSWDGEIDGFLERRKLPANVIQYKTDHV